MPRHGARWRWTQLTPGAPSPGVHAGHREQVQTQPCPLSDSCAPESPTDRVAADPDHTGRAACPGKLYCHCLLHLCEQQDKHFKKAQLQNCSRCPRCLRRGSALGRGGQTLSRHPGDPGGVPPPLASRPVPLQPTLALLLARPCWGLLTPM